MWLLQLWNTRHHPDDVRSSLQESLDRLQVTYLDLYLIHWPMSFKVLHLLYLLITHIFITFLVISKTLLVKM